MSGRPRIRCLTAILLLTLCPLVATADMRILVVDLRVNQQDVGDTFVLQDEAGSFYVSEAVLRQWDVQDPLPEPVEFRGDIYYSLCELDGATTELDSRLMQLEVFLPPRLMATRNLDLNRYQAAPTIEDTGLYMDYQLNAADYAGSGNRQFNARLQPVLFGEFGNVSANTLYRHRSTPPSGFDDDAGSGLALLDLTWSKDDPERMRSLRFGDIITRTAGGGSSFRMGGLQVGTNFSTRPLYITYPLPQFYGEATVPTALDVYVNGQLRRREQVEPGSYVLEDIPVINGAGQLQVVARDALGQQQIFSQDFYSSTELLKEGLTDYSFSIGAIREDYGVANFQYGAPAAAGTWRHGLNGHHTVEAHAEVTDGLALLGAGSRYVVPAGGTVRSDLAVSSGREGSGARWRLGFRQQIDTYSYNLDIAGAGRNFRVAGSDMPAPAVEVFLNAGRNFFEQGAIGASLVHREYHDRSRQSVFSLNYNRSFQNRLRLSSFISYTRDIDDDVAVGLRFSMPLGERQYASGGFTDRAGRQVLEAQYRRALPRGNGFGYYLGASVLDSRFLDAGGSWQTQYGNYNLDVRNNEGSGTAWLATASGSVAWLDGLAQFTRRIDDGFAVVNVGGIEGVRVYAENIEIGRTNEDGQLFVPGLRPYLNNQLRIEVDDVPLNASVGQANIVATPYSRSGVVVNFDVRMANNVMMRVVTPDGRPLPEGAMAEVSSSLEEFPVGMDGKLFLQNIDRSSEVTLRWHGKSCTLDVPFPAGGQVIARVGEVVCEPVDDR